MKETLGLYETFKEATKKYSDKVALGYFNVRYTPEEFCKIIDRTHSKMLFVMGLYAASLATADDQLNVEKVVVCSGTEGHTKAF